MLELPQAQSGKALQFQTAVLVGLGLQNAVAQQQSRAAGHVLEAPRAVLKLSGPQRLQTCYIC